jgi:hypothetical protein
MQLAVGRRVRLQSCSKIMVSLCIHCVHISPHTIPLTFYAFVFKVDGCNRIQQLKHGGWRKNNGRCLSNVQLWKGIYAAMMKCKSVTFEHALRHDLMIPSNRVDQRLKLRWHIKRERDHRQAMHGQQ